MEFEWPAILYPEPISLKQIIFIFMTIGYFAVALPLVVQHKWVEKACIFGMMVMVISPIDITLFSYTNYKGWIRGIEFGVIDWLQLTVLYSMMHAPRWQKHKLYFKHDNMIPMALYLGICALTIFTSAVPQFAFFGTMQTIRGFITFWIAYNYIRSEEDLRFIMFCVVAVSIYNFYQVLMDRYVRGIFPPRGAFTHQNSLATFQNYYNYVIFAMLMGDNEKVFDKTNKLYWFGLGAGAFCVLASLSRGALAWMILGFLGTVLISFFLKHRKKKKKKKLKALGLMFLMALPAMAVFIPAIIHRFETAPKNSEEARTNMNHAAGEMGDDFLFGLGLNNYSFGVNNMKYSRWLPPFDRGVVHSLYYLHYGEMGMPGLVIFLIMTGGFHFVIIRFILKRKDSIERNFAIGCLMIMISTMLVGKLEWNWRQVQMMFPYFMFAGFALSLARVEKDREKHDKKEKMRIAYMFMMMSKRFRKK